MEDNLSIGYEPCDIHYFYNTGASILLDEDFESTSTFVLGGFDSIMSLAVYGLSYHAREICEERYDGAAPAIQS